MDRQPKPSDPLQELINRAQIFKFGLVQVEKRANDKWAITWLGCCLAKPSKRYPSGRWVEEPSPSDRSDHFIATTRFDLSKAVQLAKGLEVDPYIAKRAET